MNFIQKSLSLLLLLCLGFQGYSQKEPTLEDKVAQLFMLGFRGTQIDKSNDIYTAIEKYKIGGVILFEYDVPSKSRPRNISSKSQLKKLIAQVKSLSTTPIFVSIDQEGGWVNRLKPQYGFISFPSPAYLGNLNNEDSTRYWAKKTAETLHELGFNLNFAPCVDVNVNPNCPVIGKIGRSFSDNPETVANNARWWIEEQNNQSVYSSLKHFPGHGSSTTDTHLEFTDVTKSWQRLELTPYSILIPENNCPFIMSSHIMNKQLDSVNPATLSKKVLTDLLRTELNYKGIIISDDMNMGAIIDNYTFADAIEKGINAGIDIFIYSNNGKSYYPNLAKTLIETTCQLVKEGKISEERINESYNRIMEIKKKLK